MIRILLRRFNRQDPNLFPYSFDYIFNWAHNYIFFVCADDPKLAARVHAFLERYGLINFGVYKVLKMPPPGKCSNLLEVFLNNHNSVLH